MIMRLQLDAGDLARMANSLDPEDVTIGDIMNFCRSWTVDMHMFSFIYYDDGPRRYYWKNRNTGLTGWAS